MTTPADTLSSRAESAAPVGAPAPSSAPVIDRKAAAADRERKRQEKRDRDAKAARDRRAAKKAAAGEKAPAPVAEHDQDEAGAPSPARTDEHRAIDGALFLRALYRLAGLVAGLFGYEVAPLTDEDAAADAAILAPLAARHLWLDKTLTLVAPLALVERFLRHVHKRKPQRAAGELVALPSPSSPTTTAERKA